MVGRGSRRATTTSRGGSRLRRPRGPLAPAHTVPVSKRGLPDRLTSDEVKRRIQLVEELDEFIETFDSNRREHRRLLDRPGRKDRKSWTRAIWVAYHDPRFNPRRTGVNMDVLRYLRMNWRLLGDELFRRSLLELGQGKTHQLFSLCRSKGWGQDKARELLNEGIRRGRRRIRLQDLSAGDFSFELARIKKGQARRWPADLVRLLEPLRKRWNDLKTIARDFNPGEAPSGKDSDPRIAKLQRLKTVLIEVIDSIEETITRLHRAR